MGSTPEPRLPDDISDWTVRDAVTALAVVLVRRVHVPRNWVLVGAGALLTLAAHALPGLGVLLGR